MFVRRHCQNEAGRPRHSTPLATQRGEQQHHQGPWRSDSINIYHNHKIKLFSKSIACDSIGGIDLRGRDLREWRNKSKSTTRKISLHFCRCTGAASLHAPRDGSTYIGNVLISAEITAGQIPIKSSGIHLRRERSNWTFGYY